MTTYPDDTLVQVKYPLQDDQPREAWPYLLGVIAQRCGPDEWMIALTDRSLAELEDGTPAPAGTPNDDLWFPTCYRDRSEIKQCGLHLASEPVPRIRLCDQRRTQRARQ